MQGAVETSQRLVEQEEARGGDEGTGQGYALVRPPGYNAGKPWYLPQCGAGRDGVDPNKDPEDG